MRNYKKNKLASYFSRRLGILLTMLCLVFFQATGFGQTKSISGTVSTNDGELLPGVSIVIKGTVQGTVTDIDGKFQLNVSDDDFLQLSFIGYESQEIPVAGRTTFSIQLAQDVESLDEVVVIGYGKTSRAKMTTAVAKVDAEKLSDIPISSNAAVSLIGKAAGVTVVQTSGDPRDTPSIWIRGGTDTDPTNDSPLYIIDGVIRDNMNDLNSNDIATFTILKDAASTAIYGARAANGVILITTKRGQKGEGKVEVRYNYQYKDASRYKNDYFTPEEEVYYGRISYTRSLKHQGYSTGYDDWLRSSTWIGTGGDITGRYSLQYAEDVRSAFGGQLPGYYTSITDPITGREIAWDPQDWQEENLQAAQTHSWDVNFSGGGEKSTYYLSANMQNAEGNTLGSIYKRMGLVANGDQQINKRLKVGSNINFSYADDGPTGTSKDTYGILERSAKQATTIRIYNQETGEYVPGTSSKPNIGYWLDNNISENHTTRLMASAYLEWEIIDGLVIKPSASVYNANFIYGGFTKNYAYSSTRNAGASNTTYLKTQYDGLLTYDKTIDKKHSINVMAGTSFINDYNYVVSGTTWGAPTDYIPLLDAGIEENDNASSDYVETAIQSWFGRFNYVYDGRYILSGSIRRDGSYNFSKEYKWATFPGFSAGWNIHKESFWNVSEVDNLKLRASYGVTGKNNISIYDTQGRYSTINYGGMVGITNTTLANESLKWETTKSYDIGLEIGLFNRVDIFFDYYYKNSYDRLYNQNLPSYTGFTSIKTNFGEYISNGVELEVSALVVKSDDFKWNVDFNISYNKSHVGDLPENGNELNRDGGFEVYDPGKGAYVMVSGIAEGERPDMMYGYKSEGVFATQKEADAWHVDNQLSNGTHVRAMAGDVKFKDVDGNGIIDSKDRVFLGYTLPSTRGGLTNTFMYKDFSLNIGMDFAFGHSVYNYSDVRNYSNGQGEDRPPSLWIKGWMYEGDQTDYSRVMMATQVGPNNTLAGNSSNTNAFSDFVYKANYLAFREVTLAYNLPRSVLGKVGFIEGLRVNATGSNLGWIKNSKLRNPEEIDGVDRYGFPTPKIFSFSIKATF